MRAVTDLLDVAIIGFPEICRELLITNATGFFEKPTVAVHERALISIVGHLEDSVQVEFESRQLLRG